MQPNKKFARDAKGIIQNLCLDIFITYKTNVLPAEAFWWYGGNIQDESFSAVLYAETDTKTLLRLRVRQYSFTFNIHSSYAIKSYCMGYLKSLITIAKWIFCNTLQRIIFIFWQYKQYAAWAGVFCPLINTCQDHILLKDFKNLRLFNYKLKRNTGIFQGISISYVI